jgi:hypothetical protein
MRECPLCGGDVTGSSCPSCGWVSAEPQPEPVPRKPKSGQQPAVPPPNVRAPVPPQMTVVAPRPSSGGVNPLLWLVGGLVVAALVIGVAVGSQSSRSGSSSQGDLQPAATHSPVSYPSSEGSSATSGASESSYPVDTPSLAGQWIIVLDSISQTDGQFSEARSLADSLYGQYGVQVYVIDSSGYAGLNPGWWAVVLIGFSSNEEARAACSTVGRTPGDACYGRKIKG